MTPEQTGYSVLAYILERLGTTPYLLFLAVMGLGPWVITIWLSHQQDKRLSKMIEMYKSNVKLVENYELLTKSSMQINDNLQDLVILTTGTMQTLVDHIKNNLFCPYMRAPERAEQTRRTDNE